MFRQSPLHVFENRVRNMASGTLAGRKRAGLRKKIEEMPERKWCAYCTKLATTLDHVVPRYRRKEYKGQPTVDNLLPACANCNNTKGILSLVVFLAVKQHFKLENFDETQNAFAYYAHRGHCHGL